MRHFFLIGQGSSQHAAYIPPPGYDIGETGTQHVEAGFMAVVTQLTDINVRAALCQVEADLWAELGWLSSTESEVTDLRRVRADFFLAVAEALTGAGEGVTLE